MVNKSIILRLSLFALTVCLFADCKKRKAFNEENAQVTVDARYIQGENDEVVKDINTVMMEQFLLRGRSSSQSADPTGSSICGVDLDTTQIVFGVVMMNYNGKNCYGRIRSGTVKFTIHGYPVKKWKHPGCVVTVEYIRYKVKRASDGRTVQYDGKQVLTNVNGNSWFELWYLSQPNVVYTLTGEDITLTLDESKIAIFSVSRRMTFTYSNGVTTCKVEGTGSVFNRGQVENWGQGRDGKNFSTRVTSPYFWSTACGAIAPLSGEVVVKKEGTEYEMKCVYGLDQDGKANTDQCPFGWEVTWKFKKKTNSRNFGYY